MEQSQDEGCCWLRKDGSRGREGGDCGGKCQWRKTRQPCWVMHRGFSHHHSLSLPTCQHQQLNNREAGPSNAWCAELQSRTTPRLLLSVTNPPIYRVGPQPGGAVYVPDAGNNREGPQAREPSKCLNWAALEKDWPKRPSDLQLQEAWKKALIAP